MKRILRWIERRSVIVIAALLLAIAALLTWFLVSGFSPNAVAASIGIAALSTLFAAISSIASLLQAVETQKQREEQERPYVIAHFDGSSSGAVYFVVENSGNSPTLNVSIQFEPSPIDFSGRPLNEVSLFREPIDFLPPRQCFRQVIDAGHRLLAEDKPIQFRVSVSYESVYHD